MSLSRRLRIAGLSAGVIVPVLLLGAMGTAQDAKKVETAGQSKQFKNIKVLKDVPADQVIPIMHAFNSSLGVNCNFCHAVTTDSAGKHTGFELDTKPEKSKAREMVLMCKDIKKREKTLEDKTTCFMCHHGTAMPVLQPEPAAK